MATGSGTGEDGRLRRGVQFIRRHPGGLVVVAVLGLAVAGVLARTSEDSGDEASNGGPVHQPPSRSAADREDVASAPDTEGNAGEGSDATAGGEAPGGTGTTTTLTPPDVARPRPPVDLDVPPDGSDPVEVARWWTAAYVSYVGAEPGDELAKRLEPLTTASLRKDLASMPPGASYNEPIAIEGVTASQPVGAGAGNGSGDGQSRHMRVVVQTTGTVVVYNLVLELAPTGWQVGEATRL